MKKLNLKRWSFTPVFIIILLLLSSAPAAGQRFAFVDTDYILSNIPEFRAAQEQLDKLSDEWQEEIEARYQEIETLFRNYQNERVLMSEEMRNRRYEEIVNREAEAAELQRRYFGTEGELFKNQEELIRPIQDRVFNAVQKLAREGNYAVIFDAAGSLNMIYTDPRNDLSDEVLKTLGYRN